MVECFWVFKDVYRVGKIIFACVCEGFWKRVVFEFIDRIEKIIFLNVRRYYLICGGFELN